MKEAEIDFAELDWERINKGGMVGRAKIHVFEAGRTARILEISPAWNEENWCRKEHIGYVVSGTLRLDFKSRKKRSLVVKRGRGFYVPLGTAHKASCKRTTTVFIVDRVTG